MHVGGEPLPFTAVVNEKVAEICATSGELAPLECKEVGDSWVLVYQGQRANDPWQTFVPSVGENT